MSISDKSLNFGQQNFFYCNDFIGSDVSGDTDEYVCYMDRKGMILIARFNSAGDEGRYIVKTGDYDTVVAGRGNYTYVLPNELKDLLVPVV